MNLTYYIGAGASAKSIPCVKELNKDIESFKSEVETSLNVHGESLDRGNEISMLSPMGAKEKLIKDLEWLLIENKKFSTIDTFAKKLFLTDDFDSYKKLKNLLTLYFNFKQAKEPVDPRYDNLFASVVKKINGTAKLPNGLSFISWNYDIQIELSIAKFLNSELDNEFFKAIQVNPFGVSPEEWVREKFTLCKLNGSASYIQKGDKLLFLSSILKKKLGSDIFNSELLDYLLWSNSDYTNQLSFSWETDFSSSKVIQCAKKIMMDTYLLIIVGYSFPVFNRDVDKYLLSSFNNVGKIYVQDKNPENISVTVEKIIKVLRYGIEQTNYTEDFLIPMEYNPKYPVTE